MSNLATLKKLATCLGCTKDTKDIPAKSNDEAIDFICERFDCKGKVCSGVTGISLKLSSNGKVESGYWTDTAGKNHSIEIRR